MVQHTVIGDILNPKRPVPVVQGFAPKQALIAYSGALITKAITPMPDTRHALIRALFEDYITMYSKRDDRLTSRFSENFCGFTGGGDFLVKDKKAWVKITREDFAQVSEHIRIEILDLCLQDLSDDVVTATAFFHIHLPIPDHILSRETARLTLNFRLEGEVWMIVYSGISIPYHLVQKGEVYPLKNLVERNTHLENEVAERTRELMEVNFKLELLSNTDGLTAAANRRSFDNVLVQEWQRAQRSGFPLAMLMLDVDHFKAYNDHYGHLAGDDCLRALAMVLLKEVRRSGEIVARYGGEEFVVLMPDTTLDNALATARRIQKAVSVLSLKHADTPAGKVTFSFGVVSIFPKPHQLPTELIARADTALYRAKANGRDCIEVAEVIE